MNLLLICQDEFTLFNNILNVVLSKPFENLAIDDGYNSYGVITPWIKQNLLQKFHDDKLDEIKNRYVNMFRFGYLDFRNPNTNEESVYKSFAEMGCPNLQEKDLIMVMLESKNNDDKNIFIVMEPKTRTKLLMVQKFV